jgi:hypothetical protein
MPRNIQPVYEDDIIARRFCRLHSLAPHRLTALFHASLNLHSTEEKNVQKVVTLYIVHTFDGFFFHTQWDIEMEDIDQKKATETGKLWITNYNKLYKNS